MPATNYQEAYNNALKETKLWQKEGYQRGLEIGTIDHAVSDFAEHLPEGFLEIVTPVLEGYIKRNKTSK